MVKFTLDSLFSDLWTDFDDNKYKYFSLIKDKETNEYYFEIDLPGIKKEDLKIEAENNVLYISAERKGNREFKYEKSVSIPKTLDMTSCHVTLELGILRLTFKEVEKLKTDKRKSILIE